MTINAETKFMLAVAVLVPWLATAQVPLDLDLDRRSVMNSQLPWGWNFWPYLQAGYGVFVEENSSGRLRLTIETGSDRPAVTAVYRIPGPVSPEQTLAFSADVGGDSETITRISILARNIVDDESVVLAQSSSQRLGANTQGGRLKAQIVVPKTTAMIDLEITRDGPGRSWIEAMLLTVDGHPIANSVSAKSQRDLGFDVIANSAIDWSLKPAPQVDDSETSQPTLPDLESLIGEARLVLLGESTGGTAEFFQIKHQLTLALNSRLGFNVLVLEDNMANVHQLNEQLAADTWVVNQPLPGLFDLYDREEFREMISAFNDLPENPIRLWGADMQDAIGPMDQVERHMQANHEDLADEISNHYAIIRDAWPPSLATSDDRFSQLIASCSAAERMIHQVVGDAEFDAAQIRRFATVVCQAISLAQSQDPLLRDRYLADNIQWLMNALPRSKLVYSGHNSHVRLSEGSMGGHLRVALGDDVVSIGLLTQGGTYTALWPRDGEWQPGEFDLFPGPAKSIEFLLASAGLTTAALDLRQGALQATALGSPLQMRSIGPIPVDYGFEPVNVTNAFDALIFVNQTHPTRPAKTIEPEFDATLNR